MTRKGEITAEELMAQLWQNPEWVARHLADEAALKERQERSRREQEALISELANVGVRVECVYDFVNTAEKYPAAVPVLLRHLTLPYSERTKEGIIRALTVSYAGPGVLRELIRQYCAETDDRPNSMKWVLGNAISEAATPADADTIIALATDPTHGNARDSITQRLPRVVKDKARLREVLQHLMQDEQTEPYARLASRGRLY
jgi:hypothetical protein